MKILLTLLNIFSPSILIASPSTTFIKSCYDGDTCTTSKGEKIRLACIDTPEIRGTRAQPTEAMAARDFLNEIIRGETVTIRRVTDDRYGRTVGELFKNGLNIQEMIVENGHGKIYKKYSHQCEWTRQ